MCTSQRRQQARTTSQSFCLCQISAYFPVHSRICPRMHIAVYRSIHVHVRVYADRVLHFSAFIILLYSSCLEPPPTPQMYMYKYIIHIIYTCTCTCTCMHTFPHVAVCCARHLILLYCRFAFVCIFACMYICLSVTLFCTCTLLCACP